MKRLREFYVAALRTSAKPCSRYRPHVSDAVVHLLAIAALLYLVNVIISYR